MSGMWRWLVPGAPAVTPSRARKRRVIVIKRMDNVGIVVDNLAAAPGFFVELGLELEGEGRVGGG
jgi:hypothetical protein